ncbi:bifunctional diaminohydroxyphosphoribosylaminopyrimidine deaminase/5-amino-6-(5-phosphoribosylamino)uracil reductase RibD [Rhizobiales bacterium RZME27]|uniref:Riboflavin biosynthesis protein RibD n=1 Tax=Endobacterium cereale TaxID=2663029 RepID=A0A6A8AAF8_9HYPH|nr:bifunctional diaminohydroxyphosphoribosylaminopyrimidine deaminase/5-amino-6-(5-phosphoribosylamino)uracil reductase RibD [Endobacterium cereale]MEB2843991.1 bifunctional diaminohydroxyphosphoribosylaminopyrimidine deaminase/5-amino-6-(5-phosphoribosylamino)uracil reductase RibD [Endobacterium cereale]MQY46226.1 bifunctional diaminohydroxyphosphoribosylaminopyrimidine deaminase/5-amino-6-(5-phosphoribosylamino)uracil reductase RibD [Endobacterium cereale]
MSTPEDDRRFMAEAIRVSRTHTGLTDTNPSVGCVIVKDGQIVGSAVTAIGGRPHAETQAIAIAGDMARGATAYVTLEPCAHWGRTPPCANALVDAGVARVVVAVFDPDPRVAGQGLKILSDAGITVETGLMEEEGRRALAGYLMRQTRGRPFVTLKLAVSADGMLGRRGEEVAITGAQVRTEVHHLRAQSDAILVGIGTVLSDDPELTVRIPGLEHRSPLRIVLDRDARFPQTSRLARTADNVPVIVAAIGAGVAETDSVPTGDAPCRCGQHDHAEEARQTAITHINSPTLEALLKRLATRGISTLLVEGGATVASAFLAQDLVDRIILYVSDKVVGEGGLESPLTPSDIPPSFTLLGSAPVGPDRVYEYERSA